MATLPTQEEVIRAIFDVYKEKGTRPGEVINQMEDVRIRFKDDYRAAEIEPALQAMIDNGWITLGSGPFIKLTESGYAQV